jgi:hypothetical protein
MRNLPIPLASSELRDQRVQRGVSELSAPNKASPQQAKQQKPQNQGFSTVLFINKLYTVLYAIKTRTKW